MVQPASADHLCERSQPEVKSNSRSILSTKGALEANLHSFNCSCAFIAIFCGTAAHIRVTRPLEEGGPFAPVTLEPPVIRLTSSSTRI